MKAVARICVMLMLELCVRRIPGMPHEVKIGKDTPVCYSFDESKAPHLLYTGHSTVGSVPILEYKISELTSFDSEFELRTLDPEGVIFFGDIGSEFNWFLLAVKKRHLSVQTGHGNDRVIVSAGPVISDGEWKKIVVTKKEGGVSVSVNGDNIVTVQQSQESIHAEAGDGLLRIAIGACTPNSSITLAVAQPPLDGCMRNWDWVKQDSSVLHRLLQDSQSQRCWEHIVPGSFFPGKASVGFAPQVLWNATVEQEKEGWSLTVELAFRPVEDKGVLFAILDPHKNVSFSLSLDQPTKDLVLHLGGQVFGSRSAPPSLCSGESQFLQLQVREGEVVTMLGAEEVMRKLEDKDFQYLKSLWSQPGSMVYLGGLPEGASSFHGCLQAKVQGVDVDVDLAEVKHGDVHSHSCPPPWT